MNMKYMLLMQGTLKDMNTFLTWPKDVLKKHIEFMDTYNKELQKNGEWVVAEGLEWADKAKIVTAKSGGAPAVFDGPFAETKEFLAGWWIVNVRDEARAIELAAKASAAPGPGGKPMNMPIEVRAIGTAPEV
jgi:hypothetical protein